MLRILLCRLWTQSCSVACLWTLGASMWVAHFFTPNSIRIQNHITVVCSLSNHTQPEPFVFAVMKASLCCSIAHTIVWGEATLQYCQKYHSVIKPRQQFWTVEASAAHAAIAWQSPLPTLLCEILTGIVLTPLSIFETGMMNNANDIPNTYYI